MHAPKVSSSKWSTFRVHRWTKLRGPCTGKRSSNPKSTAVFSEICQKFSAECRTCAWGPCQFMFLFPKTVPSGNVLPPQSHTAREKWHLPRSSQKNLQEYHPSHHQQNCIHWRLKSAQSDNSKFRPVWPFENQQHRSREKQESLYMCASCHWQLLKELIRNVWSLVNMSAFLCEMRKSPSLNLTTVPLQPHQKLESLSLFWFLKFDWQFPSTSSHLHSCLLTRQTFSIFCKISVSGSRFKTKIFKSCESVASHHYSHHDPMAVRYAALVTRANPHCLWHYHVNRL